MERQNRPPFYRPVFLPPSTPSELLNRILPHHGHPTTLLICWPKKLFLEGLVDDVRQHLGQDDDRRHPLLQTPLLQEAVSRHLHVAFIPTVAHLRAYLAVFRTRRTTTRPPPQPSDSRTCSPVLAPLLMAYGFVELHRDGSEWSAQGLNRSAAILVESAAGNGLRATVTEPRKTDDADELAMALDEKIPVLSRATGRDGETVGQGSVPVHAVFDRWFEYEAPRQVPVDKPE
ncbi:hypothetical protein GQ602_002895 [Ophiocordyceps camponoti-floridani]|uniref:Uncharacterized protein n=1 Tax=Ophiocordyceps camponoti-floridani TaxID=2030778 RepID=A0A8H4QBM3_9HYPO|nr:hypothetical protein GQ602_002895 [Ophiocordyceps camponoti-floridani]